MGVQVPPLAPTIEQGEKFRMKPQEKNFGFAITQETPSNYIACITVPKNHIDTFYQGALLAQKAEAHTYGFSKGATPLHYIEQTFRPSIIEHLKELFFIHGVMGFLCQSLYQHKLVIAGEPTLVEIQLDAHKDASFIFSLIKVAPEKEERWKRLTLRAPERKNYKDLDCQVDRFIKEEQDKAQKQQADVVSMGDWVCFVMDIVNNDTSEPLLPHYHDLLWLRMNDEEADLEIHTLFLGKKKDDIFTTQSKFLQGYISNKLDMHYTFRVTIKDFIPHAYFSFDQFKRHFQVKSPKETHQKLIEVFSFRNDISQRRETVDATFRLLLKQNTISLPNQLLESQRQLVLDQVHLNPDYHVYKAQSDFKEKIKLLAEKQLKEAIVIDTIAYQENIEITHNDVVGYLNLLKRARTKEFVYFDMPSTHVNGQEVPLSAEFLKRYCLREKTLNHVIYQLTKKVM